MREAFDVFQAGFKFGQGFKNAFGIMAGAEALGKRFAILVGRAGEPMGNGVTLVIATFLSGRAPA